MLKDTLIHVFTDLQVYIIAIEFNKTLDEMFKLYLSLWLYMGLHISDEYILMKCSSYSKIDLYKIHPAILFFAMEIII